jgi:hypothetical protein
MVLILNTCHYGVDRTPLISEGWYGKQLRDRFISLRDDILANKTNLTPPLFY